MSHILFLINDERLFASKKKGGRGGDRREDGEEAGSTRRHVYDVACSKHNQLFTPAINIKKTLERAVIFATQRFFVNVFFEDVGRLKGRPGVGRGGRWMGGGGGGVPWQTELMFPELSRSSRVASDCTRSQRQM